MDLLVLVTCTSAADKYLCLLFLFDFQVWVPWRLHGGDQLGPSGEGPAHQTGVSASLSPCPRTGSARPGGEPPAARRTIFQHVYESKKHLTEHEQVVLV